MENLPTGGKEGNKKIYYPPEGIDHIDLKPVVGVLLIRDGKTGSKEALLVKNRKTNKWYFPGGKMEMEEQEDGSFIIEDPKVALFREFKEELGIEPDLDLENTELYTEPLRTNSDFFLVYTYVLDIDTNTKALNGLEIQDSDSIEEFKWVTDPLDYDLTDPARGAVLKSGVFKNN